MEALPEKEIITSQENQNPNHLNYCPRANLLNFIFKYKQFHIIQLLIVTE